MIVNRACEHHRVVAPDSIEKLLARDGSVAQATVSHHLKELTEADLIVPHSKGQFKYFTGNQETMNEYISELQNRLKLNV